MIRHVQIPLYLILTLAACDSPFSPTVANVAGNYSVRTLTVTDTSGTTDWVAAGTTWTMSLAANGTTTGHLSIPHGGEGGADFDADMAGTWTLSGDTIQFDQTADSFVRDMPFLARENRLIGAHTFGGTDRVTFVLTK